MQPAVCGNGTIEAGEDCDEWLSGEAPAHSPTCDVDCTFPECGDGILNLGADECCEPSARDDCGANDEANGPTLDACACPPSEREGGSAGGAPIFAGYVVNTIDPTSPTPGTDGWGVVGISSVWGYAGSIGVAAGNAMCVEIGADHVCEWDEVTAADANGELAGQLPVGQSFWIHRLFSDVVLPNGVTSSPGSGGTCNDWTYPTNHIADSEMGIFQASALPGSGWQLVGNIAAKFDESTCYTGNPTTCPGGDGGDNSFSGKNCGGQGAPANSNGSVAILCCLP